jgi:hypothetical protein
MTSTMSLRACAPAGPSSSAKMQYEDTYRLAYIRGPEGIIVGLAEESRKAFTRKTRRLVIADIGTKA